jgi:hypothetical protein
MCNALLPALEASYRIPSERGSDAFKVLLAEDSKSTSCLIDRLELISRVALQTLSIKRLR